MVNMLRVIYLIIAYVTSAIIFMVLMMGCAPREHIVVRPIFIPGVIEYSARENQLLAQQLAENPQLIPFIRNYSDLRSAVSVNNRLATE